MRKFVMRGATFLVFIMMMMVGMRTSLAQTGIQVVVVNEFLNIRVTPAIGAEVITSVTAGTVFDNITARSGDNQWLRVEYQCQEGWINLAPVVILQGDINTLPTADPRSVPFGGFEAPRSGFTTQVGMVTGQATAGVRIRSGPSTGYPTVGNINFNQAFTITGRNGCATWYQVSFEGTLGWVAADFVQLTSPVNVETDLAVGGIVAESAPPQIDGDNEYFTTLRLMRDRLDLARPSLDTIRSDWTDAALQGRAICQDYPARPSDFNIPVPLLAANFPVLNPLQTDFNTAMSRVREAIDLFIQVCNQPGTGNPVGQATVQGALNILNEADQLFLSLRQRLNELIPDTDVGPDECLLIFNRKAEILPVVQYGVIYGDDITQRTYARGYCFDGIQDQIINFQVLPIPPAELSMFVSISPLDNPTDFLVVQQGTPGFRQTIGPVTLPTTGRYLLLLADLQEETEERQSFGDYAFYFSDLTFSTTFSLLAYDEASNSLTLTEQESQGGFTLTQNENAQPVQTTCPGLDFGCAELFSCDEVSACLAAGNFSLDIDGDGIGCNEPGNLVLNTVSCTTTGTTTNP
ncbi:MAG: SH3 domain-containing protein [Chloroflexota bacterium]